jgi:hypothetical protein
VWSFAVQDGSADGQPVRIVTESRVICADRASKVKFTLYWALVRPFSGLVRILMLRAIQRTCAASGVQSWSGGVSACRERPDGFRIGGQRRH